jgi:hypothetical protein
VGSRHGAGVMEVGHQQLMPNEDEHRRCSDKNKRLAHDRRGRKRDRSWQKHCQRSHHGDREGLPQGDPHEKGEGRQRGDA